MTYTIVVTHTAPVGQIDKLVNEPTANPNDASFVASVPTYVVVV